MTENKDKQRENWDNQRERERRWAYPEATKAGEWLGKGGDWNGERRHSVRERGGGDFEGVRDVKLFFEYQFGENGNRANWGF